MLFREVLSTTQAVIRKQTWVRAEHELTLVRDLAGRIRVLVQTLDQKMAPLPDESQRQILDQALKAALGKWVKNGESAVWIDGQGQKEPMREVFKLLKLKRTRWGVDIRGEPRWYRVERHAAKRAWVGDTEAQGESEPPWPLKAVDQGHRPAIVTFFSHKGGVGRTTALMATALNMAHAGLRVVAVDLDLEAPGLSALLPESVPVQREGVIDYLVEGAVGGVTPVRNILIPMSNTDIVGDGEPLRMVPAGQVDEDFLQMLARIDMQDVGIEGGLKPRLLELFKALNSEIDKLDFILVDARAGFHEVGGLMLAELSHGAVVVGLNNPQSWWGVEQVARLLRASSVGSKEPTPLVLVHGMAPPADQPLAEAEIEDFRSRAHKVLSQAYYSPSQIPDPQQPEMAHDTIPVRWKVELRGKGGSLTKATVEQLLGQDYKALARRLARRFGRLFTETKGKRV